METRKKFEVLPGFKEGLTHCHYNKSINDYDSNVAHDNEWEWHTQFVSGGWYAFQEQQIKLDAIKKKLSDIYDACDEYKTVGHLLDEIQELLK